MALYTITHASSPAASFEPVSVAQGNVTIFHARDESRKQEMEQWLLSPEVGQSIVAQTSVEGKPVFVTQGTRDKEALKTLLESSGAKVELLTEKHGLEPWKIRSFMSNLGQSLNLLSAYRKPGGIATDKMGFAGLNFAASYINGKFGAQKEHDPHRLAYLKHGVETLIAPHVSESGVINAQERHADKYKEPEPPATIGKKLNQFVTDNSVRINIGLRYLGSLAMVFPVKNWEAVSKQETLPNALQTALNGDKTNLATGLAYITGKTASLFSLVEDPYNPVPSTGLKKFREKYVFRLATVIETAAASILAVGNFKPDKNGNRDLIGGFGGAALVTGLVSRFFAPFGTKQVDREEVYAYAADSLAKAPVPELPQLIADCAAFLAEDMKLEYGKVYTRLTNDLYSHHHLALPQTLETTQENSAPLVEEAALSAFTTLPKQRHTAFIAPKVDLLNKLHYRTVPNGKNIVADRQPVGISHAGSF